MILGSPDPSQGLGNVAQHELTLSSQQKGRIVDSHRAHSQCGSNLPACICTGNLSQCPREWGRIVKGQQVGPYMSSGHSWVPRDCKGRGCAVQGWSAVSTEGTCTLCTALGRCEERQELILGPLLQPLPGWLGGQEEGQLAALTSRLVMFQ